MRVAVFVDAGYLFAQGSCAVTGLKTPKARETLVLKTDEIVGLLKRTAQIRSGGKELLRIYWYDGAPLSGPSPDQMRLAKLDDVKLRLGQLNSLGQQKGVDSLIVTDLMELARNKAIGDALLLTGDEDIRVGVQIAQSLGVRVHLLGITSASTQERQSETLQQESDTIESLAKNQVMTFLSLRAEAEAANTKAPLVTPAKPGPEYNRRAVERVIDFLRAGEKLAQAQKVVKAGKDTPGYAVKHLNEILESLLSRKATGVEKKAARDLLAAKLKAASDAS